MLRNTQWSIWKSHSSRAKHLHGRWRIIWHHRALFRRLGALHWAWILLKIYNPDEKFSMKWFTSGDLSMLFFGPDGIAVAFVDFWRRLFFCDIVPFVYRWYFRSSNSSIDTEVSTLGIEFSESDSATRFREL